MTNLLNSLVDRALGVTPVLERRQPALFEPVPDSGPGRTRLARASGHFEEQETLVELQGPVEQRSAVHHGRSIPSPDLSIKEKPVTEPRSEVQPQRQKPSTSPKALPEEHMAVNDRVSVEPPVPHDSPPRIVMRDSTAQSRSDRVDASKAMTITPQRQIETIVETRVERDVVTERYRELPLPAKERNEQIPNGWKKVTDLDQKDISVTLPNRAISPPKPKQKMDRGTITRRRTEPAPVVVPAIRAISAIQHASPLQSPDVPAIHVTIGRVEVRASLPPARETQASSPRGPRTTLDDYLRSRRGERR